MKTKFPMVHISFDVPADKLTMIAELIQPFIWPQTLKGQLEASLALERKKGGKLARQAGIMCSSGAFRRFLRDVYNVKPRGDNNEVSADWLRHECRIGSRAELDHDPDAAAKFQRIAREYAAWMAAPEMSAKGAIMTMQDHDPDHDS